MTESELLDVTAAIRAFNGLNEDQLVQVSNATIVTESGKRVVVGFDPSKGEHFFERALS